MVEFYFSKMPFDAASITVNGPIDSRAKSDPIEMDFHALPQRNRIK